MKRIAMLTLPLILFASFAWAGHMSSPTLCDEGYYARGIGVDGSAIGCTQDVAGEAPEGETGNAFITITADSGNNSVADIAADTLAIVGGDAINTESSDTEIITINFDGSFSDVAGSIADGQIPDAIARDVELFGGSFSDLADSIADAQLPDTNAMDSELHTQSHDNTDHSTNYAVAGGAEHDSFSDFVTNEHLLPATLAGEGLTDNGTALDVDANIRASSHSAQWFSPEDADSNVLLFRATGAGAVTEIECFATGGGTTIVVYKNSAVSISNGTFTCTSGTWVSDTALTNTTISDNDSFYVDIIAANSASKIFVQINYTE